MFVFKLDGDGMIGNDIEKNSWNNSMQPIAKQRMKIMIKVNLLQENSTDLKQFTMRTLHFLEAYSVSASWERA